MTGSQSFALPEDATICTPCVDILMATYNGEAFLEEQLDSIKAQSYDNWRLLVSDDCSSDDTLHILNHYAQTDSRIEIVSVGHRFGGAKNNFLSLLQQATAPYVMFCDQDDVWRSDKIMISLNKMIALEEDHGEETPLLVYTDLKVVDHNLALISDSFMRREGFYPPAENLDTLLFCNNAPGCTMLMNIALVREAVLAGDIDFISIHDWWLVILAAAIGYVAYVDVPTVDYRQHERNAIGVSDARKKAGLLPSIANARKRSEKLRERAAALLRLYPEKLHEREAARLSDLVASGRGGVRALLSLIKSGYWSQVPHQRVGQILATLSNPSQDSP